MVLSGLAQSFPAEAFQTDPASLGALAPGGRGAEGEKAPGTARHSFLFLRLLVNSIPLPCVYMSSS